MSFEKELIETLEPLVDKVLDLEEKLQSVQGIRAQDGVGVAAETWVEGVYRSDSIVTHNIGQIFKALKDTAAEPGTSPDWERLGTLGFRHCGAFDESREYQEGDTYIKNYGWFAILNGKSVCIAGRGAKGERGERGENGLPGLKGADGADIVALEARGLSIVMITRAPGGRQGEFVIDLAPTIKSQFDALQDDIEARINAKMISVKSIKQIVANCSDWNAFKSAIASLEG